MVPGKNQAYKEGLYMKIFIYSITNKLNGKVYYGKTHRPIEKRFRTHCRPACKGNQTALKRAIRKYGKDNFTVKILSYCRSNETASQEEIRLIRIARTSGQKLYNMTNGGDGLVGYKFTKEQSNRLSKSMLGRAMTWSDKIHATLRKSPKVWRKRISHGMQCMSVEKKLARCKKIHLFHKHQSPAAKALKDLRISRALKKSWRQRKSMF